MTSPVPSDKKQQCAALFVDLSKAFDSVDHELLSIFINDLGEDVQAHLHLHADDTIIYTFAPSAVQATDKLQTAFQSLQRGLKDLLSRVCLQNFNNLNISTSDGTLIERVSSYKYQGI